jgi:hypothetical protein
MDEIEDDFPYDPVEVIERYRSHFSDRKLRLFAVACCRSIWPLLTNEYSRKAVEVAEMFADGLVHEQDLDNARQIASEVADQSAFGSTEDAYYCSRPADVAVAATRSDAYFAAQETAVDAAEVANFDAEVLSWAESQGTAPEDLAQLQESARIAAGVNSSSQIVLLCDILGTPSNLVAINPIDRSWVNQTVVAMARRIYEDRAFALLPMLADALEEAGCNVPNVLHHCRAGGPHVRGCWVIDLLVDKQ